MNRNLYMYQSNANGIRAECNTSTLGEVAEAVDMWARMYPRTKMEVRDDTGVVLAYLNSIRWDRVVFTGELSADNIDYMKGYLKRLQYEQGFSL